MALKGKGVRHQDVELRRTNLTQSLRTFVGRNPKRFSKPKLLPSKEKNFDVGQGSTRAETRPKKSDQRPLEVRKLVPSREGQNSAENVRKKAEKGPRKGRKSPRIGRKWLGVQGLKTLDQASQVRSAIAREKSVKVQTKNRRRSFKDRCRLLTFCLAVNQGSWRWLGPRKTRRGRHSRRKGEGKN